MRTFTYPAIFEPGDGEADAHAMGSDALGVALLAIQGLGRPMPAPTAPEPGAVLLTVAADIAAKLAVIEAFNESGLTRVELAKRLGKDEREVRRILDRKHATKMPALMAALAALGRPLVIGVEAA